MTQLLTPAEVCQALRVGRTSLWKLRQAKKVRAVVIAGKVLFRAEDIQHLIENSTYPKRIARI